MDFKTLHKQRKFILITAALGLMAVFLPWITVSAGFFGESMTKSTNGFHGIGILAFLSFAAAGIIACVGTATVSLEKGMWLAALVAGVLSLLSVVIFMLNSMDQIGSMGFAEAGYGFGLWIALAGALGVTGSVWFLKSPEDSLKAGLESLKGKLNATTANSGTASVAGQQSSTKATTDTGSDIEALEKLIALKNEGKITEEEYQLMRSKLF